MPQMVDKKEAAAILMFAVRLDRDFLMLSAALQPVMFTGCSAVKKSLLATLGYTQLSTAGFGNHENRYR